MHTKGPWCVSNGHLLRIAAKDSDWKTPATICGVHRIGKRIGRQRTKEVLANAHLIAAAPDLLDALKEMVSSFPLLRDGALGYEEDAHAKARAAIAKAKGE